jgi:hypothetical protein
VEKAIIAALTDKAANVLRTFMTSSKRNRPIAAATWRSREITAIRLKNRPVLWNAEFYITEGKRESRSLGIVEVGTFTARCYLKMKPDGTNQASSGSGADLVPVGMAAYRGIRCAG